MNVNWKNAILQAQQKIDQVLDIKPEPNENDIHEAVNEESHLAHEPVKESENEVVLLEPILPPLFPNNFCADELQTIASSDIEPLTRFSSRSVSPEVPRNKFESEKKVEGSRNTESELVHNLKKELNDYKSVNEILQNNCKNLEQNLQEKSVIFNQTLMEIRKEEISNLEIEVSHLKRNCLELTIEKKKSDRLIIKNASVNQQVINFVVLYKKQLATIKEYLKRSKEIFSIDIEKLNKEIRTYSNNALMVKLSEFRQTPAMHLCEQVITRDASVQTENDDHIKISQNLERNQHDDVQCREKDFNSHPSKLMWIIEQLEKEKGELSSMLEKKEIEIHILRNSLNESLIMQGEKIEMLEELRIDNDELRCLLKEQALALAQRERVF